MNGIETYLLGAPLMAVGAAFAGGLLAGLSPCVYVMIPIVTAYVGGRSVAERITCTNCAPAPAKALEGIMSAGRSGRGRSFALSLSYVIGMAMVYSVLGMIAALTGGLFGSISTSPWALLIVANFLVLFALNMLDVFPFPTWFQRLVKPKPSARGIAGAVLIGAASGLVASPCTSPVLLALLTYVATSHSVAYGGALLFSFSLGMGFLLIIAGTFSGIAAALPKSGGWMTGVKKVFGLLMLGLAEYYLIQAGQAWL